MEITGLHCHEKPITSIVYNYDGDLLFSACKEGKVAVWKTNPISLGGMYELSTSHRVVVWDVSPSRKSEKLLGCNGYGIIICWDIETGRLISSVDQSPNNKKCIQWAGCDNKYLTVLESTKSSPSSTLFFDYRTSFTNPFQSISAPPSVQFRLAIWSKDDKSIYVVDNIGYIRQYDVSSGNLIIEQKIHNAEIKDLRYSPDKTFLISASIDHTAAIINPMTLEVFRRYKSNYPVNGADFSPIYEELVLAGGQDPREVTSTTAAVGGFDICLYSAATANKFAEISGQYSTIHNVVYHPDGESLACSTESGIVSLYKFDEKYHFYQR